MRPSNCLVLALYLALAPFAVCPAANYTITDLGSMGQPVYAINNSGQVAGTSDSIGPFLYSGGQITALHYEYQVAGINSKGDATGFSSNFYTNPIVWSGGGVSFLARRDPYFGGVMAINTEGDVAGGDPIYDPVVAGGGPIISHAFLYSAGAMHDLGTLGGDFGLAQGINDNGQIVGQSDTTSARHAFLVNGGPMQDLNSLTGPASPWVLTNATAINGTGQITGFGTINGQRHGFVYDSGTVNDIGVLPGFTSTAGTAINSHGQVVGFLLPLGISSFSYGFSLAYTGHALLYGGGTTYDLNSLIDPASHWVLREATGINDSGQIVGWGTSPNGIAHAFLLTPVPEPSSVILAAIALMGLVACVGRSRSRREGGRA